LYQTPHECYTSINAAIDEAVTSDQITAYPGTHYETLDFDGKAITVRSTDPNDAETVAATIIDANGADRAVYFHNSETGSSVLRGFTITGADDHGIECSGASPTIEQCLITDNGDSDEGGGMRTCNGSPTVKACVFYRNDGEDGGGMAIDDSAATVINCLFYDNTATEDGGGMYVEDSASPTVINCTFFDNYADDDGGGVHTYECSAAFTNCILWNNDAGGSGQEIYNRDTDVPTFSDSCIRGDLNGSYCDGEDSDSGGGNDDEDPDFENENDPNGADNLWATCDDGLRIKSTSDCKDEGDNDAVSGVDTDIKGSDRIINSTVDMGAYEYDSGC
jgi:parallel beta-helix repeat protein